MTLFNQMSERSITIQTLHILEDGQDPQTFDWKTGGYLSFEVYEVGLPCPPGTAPLLPIAQGLSLA
jgi:hypothetical protein